MSDARYYVHASAPMHPVAAAEALARSLTGTTPPADLYTPVMGPHAVCAALFSVLTESQQERALQALGWLPVPSPLPRPPDDGAEPTAAVHDPEPTRWQDKAAAWLRAKADEQEARNSKFPAHADAYPSWRERVDQWRALAVEVVRVP